MTFDVVSFVADFTSYYALYLAICLSLNLEFGYAGIPNFGKVLFIAGGAAFAGSITGRVAVWALGVNTHGDFITFNFAAMGQVNQLLLGDPLLMAALIVLGLVVGAAIGAILGYVMSYPAIHLREDYLGLLLLGMAQFFYLFLTDYTPLVGATQSILTINPFLYFSTLNVNDLVDVMYAVAMGAFAIFVWLYVNKTVKSPLGRALRAVRDNDEAASALGKDTAKMRRNALMVASAIAGMAGTMFTFQVAFVGASTWTRFAWTFWPFLIVIIGGVANNKGVALGAFFFVLILKGLEQVQPYIAPYIFNTDPSFVQDLIFSVLLLTILYLRPEGILRERSTRTLPRRELEKMTRIVGEAGAGTPGSAAGGSGQAPGGAGVPGRIKTRIRQLLQRDKEAPVS